MQGTSPRVTVLDSRNSPPSRILLPSEALGCRPDGRHRNESAQPQVPQRKGHKATELCIICVFLPFGCGLLRKQPREVPISDRLTASCPSGSQGNHALVDQGIFLVHEPSHKYTAERRMPPGRCTVRSRGQRPPTSFLPPVLRHLAVRGTQCSQPAEPWRGPYLLPVNHGCIVTACSLPPRSEAPLEYDLVPTPGPDVRVAQSQGK